MSPYRSKHTPQFVAYVQDLCQPKSGSFQTTNTGRSVLKCPYVHVSGMIQLELHSKWTARPCHDLGDPPQVLQLQESLLQDLHEVSRKRKDVLTMENPHRKWRLQREHHLRSFNCNVWLPASLFFFNVCVCVGIIVVNLSEDNDVGDMVLA